MMLITGVTGRAGSILIREFARQGVPVRALVRDMSKWREDFSTVEVAEGDMLRPETLGKALDGIDRAFMISSPREKMVETQCTFIDAARAAGVRHVVKFSGKESGTTFDPQRFKGTREHLAIERYLEASGVEWTHLRPSQFMQFYLPGSLTGVYPDRRALVMPIGESKLAPVAIEDIAKVAVAMMQAEGIEGKAYDMTGPEALTPSEIVDRISTGTGTTFRYEQVSLQAKRVMHLTEGYPPPVVDVLEDLYRERAASPESRVDLGAHETFGVEPTTFERFAQQHATAFLK